MNKRNKLGLSLFRHTIQAKETKCHLDGTSNNNNNNNNNK